MSLQKHTVVACKYELKADRIGGMDRFFRAYNDQLAESGHRVSWFFAGGGLIDFYSGIDVTFAESESLEETVLAYLRQEERVDVLVTHFMELCTSFFKAANKERVGFIIAVDHNPRPLNGFPFKKRIKNRLKGFLYATYIDCFVGVSKYTRDQILKDYGSHLGRKTTVVYNGIDTRLYLKREEDNKGRFIVASHLRESKGIQDLIEAVHLLPENLKVQVRIDIYGEGPLEGFLKEKVSNLDLQQQFRFLGNTANLPSLFHQYSYLLQPTYMECFSLSILESLASNVPVITTRVGGNPEIINEGHNGYFHAPGDIAGLNLILATLLKKERNIVEKVNALVEKNYSLEKMVREHIQLIPSINNSSKKLK